MAYRFTDTDKWRDPWFRALPANEKLLFNYLCDNCDLAGFYEVDFGMISFQTCLSEEEIKKAFKGLTRGYLGANGWIWIINFLKNQKNLPLNPENNAHKSIINLIKAQLFRFPSIPEKLGASEGLFSPPGKGKVKVEVKVKTIKESNFKIEDREVFEKARLIYPGDKLGLETELSNFIKKHKDWKDVIGILEEKIKNQIEVKRAKEAKKEFVPEWKMFSTWINKRCWEEETSKPKNALKTGNVIETFKNRPEAF